MSAMPPFHELTLSILKACGIPHEKVIAVTYSHAVDGLPNVVVTYLPAQNGETITETYTPFVKVA